jgi:hypothetical protein
VGAFVRIVSKGRRWDRSAELKLPQGAEAALWSILEAVPDPRNHLAMVRDLSGEVRVTDLEQAMLVHAYENRMPDVSTVTDSTALPELWQFPQPPVTTSPRPPTEPRNTELDETELDETELDESDGEAIVDVRDAPPPVMDPYYDLGQIAENTPLTDHLFTPSTD